MIVHPFFWFHNWWFTQCLVYFCADHSPPCEPKNRLTDRTPSKTLYVIELGDQLFTSYCYWLLFFAHVQLSRNIYSKFTWLGDTLAWVRSPCIHPGKYHMGAHTVVHVLSIHNLSVLVLVWRPTASWWRISCCFFSFCEASRACMTELWCVFKKKVTSLKIVRFHVQMGEHTFSTMN